MKIVCVLTFSLFALAACRSAKKPEPQPVPEKKPKESFLPYVSLLQDEIKLVDSTPLAIYKYTTDSKGKTDTVFIQRDEFHRLAQNFLQPDVNQAPLSEQYTASTFGDNTTGLAMFNCETRNPELEVQRINIRYKAGETSKLTSLDMLKTFPGKEPVMQKLFWKASRFFHIVTDSGQNRISKIEVAWNLAPPTPEIQPRQ